MNKEWFIFKGTHHTGPYNLKELQEFFRNEEISLKSLLWKEGTEKWEALSRIDELKSVYDQSFESGQITNSPTKNETFADIPLKANKNTEKTLPKFQPNLSALDQNSHDEPPPIPLDALLNPKGDTELFKAPPRGLKKHLKSIFFFFTFLFFLGIIAWFTLMERSSSVQIKITGVMPIYVEKLQEMASQSSPGMSLGMALSIDKTKLYATTNQNGEILSSIKLVSVPKRILGSQDVVVLVKGIIRNHLGTFDRMTMIKGPQLIPGEYEIYFSGKKIHYLNERFAFLNGIEFFKNLNTNYSYKTVTLIYPGTPRDFESKLNEYKQSILNEVLKPSTEKLEKHQTFLSLLNKVVETYLLVLEKTAKSSDVGSFEKMYIKDISPILQNLVLEANEKATQLENADNKDLWADEIANNKNQIQLGKQIGELASDMITLTQKTTKFSPENKNALKLKFESRYKFIKGQLDVIINDTQKKIETLSK